MEIKNKREREVSKPQIAPKEIKNETKKEEKESIKGTGILKAEPKIDVLQPGQKYFESPEGDIVIGEETKSQVWYRKLNNGQGGWINPKR
jgi:hypothetical protein